MKKLLSLLLALCMIFAMAACGNTTVEETKAPTEAKEPVAQATEAAAVSETEPELPKNVSIELWTDISGTLRAVLLVMFLPVLCCSPNCRLLTAVIRLQQRHWQTTPRVQMRLFRSTWIIP